MERPVELVFDCKDAQAAGALSGLFSFLSNAGHDETALTGFLDGWSASEPRREAARRLYSEHRESLSYLESNEAGSMDVRLWYVCGWGAEAFLQGLARFSIDGQLEIARLSAQGDESVVVCGVVGERILIEEFESYEEYEAAGFSDPGHPARDGRASETLELDETGKALLYGRWKLDIEKTLSLFGEKVTAEWGEMSEWVRESFSPLDEYIRELRTAYTEGPQRVLEFDEKEIVTYYGDEIHDRAPYAVSSQGLLEIEIVEYFEEMGETEELPKSLSFATNPPSMTVRHGKKVEAYNKL